MAGGVQEEPGQSDAVTEVLAVAWLTMSLALLSPRGLMQ